MIDPVAFHFRRSKRESIIAETLFFIRADEYRRSMSGLF